MKSRLIAGNSLNINTTTYLETKSVKVKKFIIGQSAAKFLKRKPRKRFNDHPERE